MGVRRSLALFRIRFYSICYACIRYQPPPVAPSERLTRFLFNIEREIDRHGNCTYWAFFVEANRFQSFEQTKWQTLRSGALAVAGSRVLEKRISKVGRTL